MESAPTESYQAAPAARPRSTARRPRARVKLGIAFQSPAERKTAQSRSSAIRRYAFGFGPGRLRAVLGSGRQSPAPSARMSALFDLRLHLRNGSASDGNGAC